MPNPKDYRIEIKVRNNRLLTKMEEMGYTNVSKLADEIGINRMTIYRIISMKSAALDDEGYYKPEAIQIAEFLKCTPQDIYPPAQMRGTITRNTAQITANANEVDSLTSSLRMVAFSPERKMILDESKKALKAVLLTLTPREQRIVDLRYGLTNGEEKTLEEVGVLFGVSRERIRHIEKKALRKMRHPSKSRELQTILNDLTVDPLDQK